MHDASVKWNRARKFPDATRSTQSSESEGDERSPPHRMTTKAEPPLQTTFPSRYDSMRARRDCGGLLGCPAQAWH